MKTHKMSAVVMFAAVIAALIGLNAFLMFGTRTVQAEMSPTVSVSGSIDGAQLVSPVSLISPWVTINTAGIAATADASTVTNVATQVTRSGSLSFVRARGGTNLRLMLGYDASLTVTQSPTVKVFGRSQNGTVWQLLKSVRGNLTETLTVASTDATDGTLKYTTSDINVHTWDCDGCFEIVVTIELPLTGTGTTSNCIILGKWI